MTWSTDPSKNVFKNPPKCHDKAVQSNILWLNLNKISGISILQLAPKQSNPHFTFMRQAQNADTHTLKESNSLGCPKIFPLSAPVLYWLLLLTCISSLKVKNKRKTLIYIS